jgi:hypothetical protein
MTSKQFDSALKSIISDGDAGSIKHDTQHLINKADRVLRRTNDRKLEISVRVARQMLYGGML